MLYSTDHIHGFTLSAQDDELGRVEDIYFDDEKWTLRYLVANTKKWLPGKSVLIPPAALNAINMDDKYFDVNLTKQQVKDSPDIDAHKPISRQHERELLTYYGFVPYWGLTGLWGEGSYPKDISKRENETEEIETPATNEEAHLRSAVEVIGYSIQATDSEFGYVEDFILEEDTWRIRYIVVNTKSFWFGKKILISPNWITKVDWDTRKVYINLSKDKIKSGPEYDSNEPITEEFEKQLDDMYKGQHI